jgi:hypothetical protein
VEQDGAEDLPGVFDRDLDAPPPAYRPVTRAAVAAALVVTRAGS